MPAGCRLIDEPVELRCAQGRKADGLDQGKEQAALGQRPVPLAFVVVRRLARQKPLLQGLHPLGEHFHGVAAAPVDSRLQQDVEPAGIVIGTSLLE